MLLLVATLAAAVTYRLIENPVRHSRVLMQRRWASVVMGLCLIGATLAVTTYEEQRPTISLGSTRDSDLRLEMPITTGKSGLAPEIHVYVQSPSGHQRNNAGSAGRRGRRFDLLHPPAGARGSGAVLWHGVQECCRDRVRCGQWRDRPPLRIRTALNLSAPTKLCQGEANRAETEAIERYRPSLIVWGSTDERDAIVNDTPAGSKILTPGSSEWKSVMLQRMDDRVEKFIATGARVILLSEPPSVHSGSQTGLNSNDIEYGEMNALLRDVAARHPKQVAVVNLQARVCPSGPPCPFVVDGFGSKGKTVAQAISNGIRPDLIHYSPTSSLWVAKWLVPRISAAANKLS